RHGLQWRRGTVHIRLGQRALRRPAVVRADALLPRPARRTSRLAQSAVRPVVAPAAVPCRCDGTDRHARSRLADGRGLLSPRSVSRALSRWLLPARLDLRPHLLHGPEAVGRRLLRTVGSLSAGGRRQRLRTDRRRGPPEDRRSLRVHRRSRDTRWRLPPPLPRRPPGRRQEGGTPAGYAPRAPPAPRNAGRPGAACPGRRLPR